MRTHLETQHGGAAVKHLDAQGVDVGRPGWGAALIVLDVADNVQGDARLCFADRGDAVAVVVGVVAPGDLGSDARLMRRNPERKKIRRDKSV